MGSKNRIELGILSKLFFHNYRNSFNKKEIIINKNKLNKIVKKRVYLKKYFNKKSFQEIVDNTVFVYYLEEDNIYNCLSFIENRYIIFGIVPRHQNEITTLFYTNEKQISKKFRKDKNLKIFSKEVF